MRKQTVTLAAVILLIASRMVMAQSGEAGRESPFSIGVGARALAMGSTGAAFPDDPSAFYWNPAGMMVVEEKKAGFSLTTLFEGTQYNFVGYVHPTMSAGTFGIGLTRIGTGGIPHTEDLNGVPVDMGELEYYWGRLTVSYALRLFKGLSVGVNLDANRQVLGSYSTNGMGVDAGILYAFPSGGGFLRGLYFGCNVTHMLSPRLKLGGVTESIPYNVRTGMAKVVDLRENRDRWMITADFMSYQEKGTTYHIGMEYGWKKSVFLRLGMDDGSVTFGTGFRLKNIQVDYGTGRIGDPVFFQRSNRFTLVLAFGKSISEKRRLQEEARRNEIQSRIEERIEAEKQKRITDGLRAGKEYMDRGDFFNARLEYSRVLREDRENMEAQSALALVAEKEQDLQRAREDELLRQDRERSRIQRDITFVKDRYSEGLDALGKGDFQKAIESWHQALERDSGNVEIRNYLDRAKEELNNEINLAIAQAERLKRQENLSEAYKVLNRAKEQAASNPELLRKVTGEIQRMDRYVDFLFNYQTGVQRYNREDWNGAFRSFQRALEIDPNHELARDFYNKSKAKALGKRSEMKGEVLDIFNRGLNLYINGYYEEAIRMWEDALKRDPENLNIIDRIEEARKKLESLKKKE